MHATCSVERHAVGTPFSPITAARSVTSFTGPPRRADSSPSPHAVHRSRERRCARGEIREDASRQSLQPTLLSNTGTLRAYRLSSSGLAPEWPPLLAPSTGSARQYGSRSANDGRWRRITADFRRQLPRPRVAERLVAAAASRSLIPTFPSGVSPGRVDRAPMARSKPAPTCSAADASPSKPSTDAPCHAARPSIESSSIDPTTPGHTSRSARAPRRTSFPAPRRPPSATTNQRRRFPEPKRLPPMSPSTPVRGRRLATASSPSPRLPARTRLRMRVLNPVRSGGPPLVPRVLPPWPSVRHAFTSRLTPSR